jgi:hypothetical protein
MLSYAEFKVLTTMVLKIYSFSDIIPCIPVIVKRRFGGICSLHFQALFATCFKFFFLFGLFLDLEDERDKFLQNIS